MELILTPERRATLRALARPALWFAVSRLLVLGAFALAALAHPTNARVCIANEPDFSHRIQHAVSCWDGDFYVDIVANGYPDAVPETSTGRAMQSSIAFFPLYPMLAKPLEVVTPLSARSSAIVAALGAGLIAIGLLWLLVRRYADAAAADRAAILFCFFPGAFVWSMTYSEPVMVAFAAATLLALLDRRWLLAGALALLGTASRPNALGLVVTCAVAAALAIRDRQEWRSLIAPALAPIGAAAFLVYLAVHTGSASAWWRVQRDGWGQTVDFGKHTLGRVRDTLIGSADLHDVITTMCLAAITLGVVCLWKWRPPLILWVYALCVIGPLVASSQPGLTPRFVHAAFPFVLAIGVIVSRRWWRVMVVGCAVAQFALAYTTIVSLRVIP